MKKKTAIFSKFPNIANTAIRDPTGYVRESPGKMCAGVALYSRKARRAATIHKPIIAIQVDPVRYANKDNAESTRTPRPASKPLKPAKKLNVVVAPTIPIGIKSNG